MLFIVLDIETLFLIPWASVFREFGLAGLIEISVFLSCWVSDSSTRGSGELWSGTDEGDSMKRLDTIPPGLEEGHLDTGSEELDDDATRLCRQLGSSKFPVADAVRHGLLCDRNDGLGSVEI